MYAPYAQAASANVLLVSRGTSSACFLNVDVAPLHWEGTAEMLPKTESASFVIADISGYTSFLAGVELDHAHDIIADVMDTVVRCLRPPFRLAKFEGDAAFFYAVADKVDGSVLQDAVEAAYFAFRKRLRNISQATSCACNACSRMQDLDLKFVCHHASSSSRRCRAATNSPAATSSWCTVC